MTINIWNYYNTIVPNWEEKLKGTPSEERTGKALIVAGRILSQLNLQAENDKIFFSETIFSNWSITGDNEILRETEIQLLKSARDYHLQLSQKNNGETLIFQTPLSLANAVQVIGFQLLLKGNFHRDILCDFKKDFFKEPYVFDSQLVTSMIKANHQKEIWKFFDLLGRDHRFYDRGWSLRNVLICPRKANLILFSGLICQFTHTDQVALLIKDSLANKISFSFFKGESLVRKNLWEKLKQNIQTRQGMFRLLMSICPDKPVEWFPEKKPSKRKAPSTTSFAKRTKTEASAS